MREIRGNPGLWPSNMTAFSMTVVMGVLLALAARARAASCVCRCDGEIQAPVVVDVCADCVPQVCLANREACQQPLRTGGEVTLEAKCVDVDPCENAFESTLCINDQDARCIDKSGRDPWQISCACAQLAANCQTAVGCPPSQLQRDACSEVCPEAQCTPTPNWRRTDAPAAANSTAPAALRPPLWLALAAASAASLK